MQLQNVNRAIGLKIIFPYPVSSHFPSINVVNVNKVANIHFYFTNIFNKTASFKILNNRNPIQAAALWRLRDNLLCVIFLCQGTPSI